LAVLDAAAAVVDAAAGLLGAAAWQQDSIGMRLVGSWSSSSALHQQPAGCRVLAMVPVLVLLLQLDT
jgi:hypothetical protein